MYKYPIPGGVGRANAMDLSYYRPGIIMINEKTLRTGANALWARLNNGKYRKLTTRNFVSCIDSKLVLALGTTIMAGSTILRVENGLRRYYLG